VGGMMGFLGRCPRLRWAKAGGLRREEWLAGRGRPWRLSHSRVARTSELFGRLLRGFGCGLGGRGGRRGLGECGRAFVRCLGCRWRLRIRSTGLGHRVGARGCRLAFERREGVLCRV